MKLQEFHKESEDDVANRLVDNVIVVDSAMGNFSVVGGASANITIFNVNAVSFWASSTLGDFILTGANTAADHIVRFGYINAGSGIVNSLQSMYLGGVVFSSLKVLTITAGTAWVYLK